MNIIFGKRAGFQKADKKLAKKLQEVLNSNEKNILIGLNLPYQNKILETYTNQRRNYFIKWFKKNKFRALKILKKKKILFCCYFEILYWSKRQNQSSKIYKKS